MRGSPEKKQRKADVPREVWIQMVRKTVWPTILHRAVPGEKLGTHG